MGLKAFLSMALILAAGQPAKADWLVLHDGAKLETRDHWEVKGSLVVFALPGGTLASVPALSVDFEKSFEASASEVVDETVRPLKRSSPARKPVLVLTNRDIPQSATAPRARGEGPETGSLASQVRVDYWAEIELPEIGGVEIIGKLRNDGAEAAQISCVAVTLLDQQGAPIRTRQVIPRESVLDAGESTRFHVRFPGVGMDRGRPAFKIYAAGGSHRGSRQVCSSVS